MKYRLIFLFCLISFGQIFSQEFRFQAVNAETADPLENVAVFLGENVISRSNVKGNFQLESADPLSLYELRSEGFETLIFKIDETSDVQILYLKPNSELIAEVLIRSALIPGSLRETPAAVSVINQVDFERNDATTILESFKNVPGVYINQGALNTNKINIRGIGSRSQYSTNRIQSYFDGIPLSTGEGELTLDDFDPETLGRIEIIKGPGSSIFGAGLGGSINLYSKTLDKTESGAKLSSQVGSFNTQKYVLQASKSSEKSSLFATFSSLTSDGYRENGNYSRQSALINGNLKTHNSGKLSYFANFIRLKAFIPSSLNLTDFTNNPCSADVAWQKSEGYESYDRGLLGLSYTQNLFKNLQNTTSVFLSFKDAYEPRPFDILEEFTASSGIRTRFNLDTQLFRIKSKVSFGAEYYNEYYKTGNFENLYKIFPNEGSVEGKRINENQQDRNYINLFAQINLQLSEKWKVETGLSFNSTGYNLTDKFVKNSKDQSGKYRFKNILSPRIGTSYEVSKGKNIYAAVSKGFSTPTVAETLTPEGQINTDLRPETGINYEIGFKGSWLQNKLYTEVSVYAIKISDLLVAQRIAEDQYVGINAGKTNHDGIEFLVNYRMAVNSNISIKPYISTALNFFKFDEFINNDKDFSGNNVPGVPDFTVNSGVDMKIGKRFGLFTNFRSVGKIFLDDANSDTSQAYDLVNLKMDYEFNILKKISLNFYAGINNLFNEKYAASILTNAVGFGGKAPRYYYPGTERNYYAGMQVSFVF